MAEATENPQTQDPEGEQEKSGRSSMLAMMKVGGIVAVILMAECLVAFLFIPSAENVTAMAEARYGAGNIPADPVASLEVDDTGKPTIEVDLKDYSVTAFQPLSNTTLRIDFHLFGTVLADEENEFNSLFTKHEHRIREQVIVTIRSSELTDLTDAGLGLVKRKILDKLNRTMGKPMVKSLIVSEFSFVEQ